MESNAPKVAVSSSDAELALREIAKAERHSAITYGYRTASPHLVVWGVIWMVGYGLAYLRPAWPLVWPALTIFGFANSIWLGWKERRRAQPFDWRYRATLLAVVLFTVAIFAILSPKTSAQFSAFVPMLVALFYCLVGIWTRGMRLLVTGIALAVLTVSGYLWMRAVFPVWMAVVGGGALILGGIWLRKP
jgi:hypothetical protein